MNQSEKHSPISSPNYCVTVIGSTPTEYERLDKALNANSGFARFNMKHELSASVSSFPASTVHAIVLTPTSLAQVRHDIDSSVDFAVFAGDKLFGLKGGI